MNVGSFVSGLIFAVVSFFVVVLFEFLLILGVENVFGGHWTPIGLGWVVMPISAALTGWAVGTRVGIINFISIISRGLDGEIRNVLQKQRYRLLFGFSCLWILSSVIYLLVFDPFDRYYWRLDDYIKATFIVIGPVAIAVVSMTIVYWAGLGDDHRNKPMGAARRVIAREERGEVE